MSASFAAFSTPSAAPPSGAGAVVLPLLRNATAAVRPIAPLARAAGDPATARAELAALQGFLLGWTPAVLAAVRDDSFVLPRLPPPGALLGAWCTCGGSEAGFAAIEPMPEVAALCRSRPAALGSLYAVQVWLAGHSADAPAERPGILPVDSETRVRFKGTLARLAGLSPDEAAEAAESTARTLQVLAHCGVHAPIGRS